MAKPWYLERDNPRTVLIVSIAALVLGLVGAPFLIQDGGAKATFAYIWLVAAVGQVAYAFVRIKRFRIQGGEAGGSNDKEPPPPAW